MGTLSRMTRIARINRLAVLLAFIASACASSRSGTGQPPGEASPASSGYDAELTNYPYPYEVKIHPVKQQGHDLKMAFMDVPPEGTPNGRVVLLLHGKNFAAAHWKETIAALSKAGFRVIAPDQIGFGKSSKPADIQYSFHALATNTGTLLDALGVDRVAVVGHSMGGMLATRFALMFPERVERLVLVNPIGLEDWKRVVPYRTIDQWVDAELAQTPEGVKNYMRESYFAGEWKPEYDALVDMQAGWTRGPDREQVAKVSALTYDMVFTQPVVHEFPDLRVPTLLIIGTRDRTAVGKAWAPPGVAEQLGRYDRLGKKAAQAIPDAQLVELENVGHIPQVEAFEPYMDALVKFVAKGP